MNDGDRENAVSGLVEQKPGWLARIFGIESAALVACDAAFEEGEWRRAESFRFLYRSRGGSYFLQTQPREWREVSSEEAGILCRTLPLRLPEAPCGD